jgi:hypothetical protein
MSRSPCGIPRKIEAFRPGRRSSPQRVEENYWSHFASRGPNEPQARFSSQKCSYEHPSTKSIRKPIVPRETCAGPCEPSRRYEAWGPPRPGAIRIDRSHAGFPQGSFNATNLFLSRLVLADECNRPNCQRTAAGLGRGDARDTGIAMHDLMGLPRSHPPTPSAGSRLRPGSLPRPSSGFSCEQSNYNSTLKISKVNHPPRFFMVRDR